MLKITSKQYEIEEQVQFEKIVDGQKQIQYEFIMQITNEEMQELKDIIFSFANDNFSRYQTSNLEERKELEKQLEEKIKDNDKRFIDICFKEHKSCKKLVGEYKFNEMVETMRGYIIGFFTEKQMSQYNTPITNLTKSLNNLNKLR